jgi:membrane protease YdiL (CAAX protease family)
MIPKVLSLIRRWPLTSFFVLTYALTWWVAPLAVPGFPVFPFGPDLAVLLVVAVTSGRPGLRRMLTSLTRWRAAPRWYALALLLPVLITLAALAGMQVGGTSSEAMPKITDALLYLIVLPLSILIGGPLGEELGFRGYALPVLMHRHSTMVAVAILCLGHLLWHLPLFFASDPPPPAAFALGLLSGGVVLAWLLNSTRNIVLVMILHGGFNAAQQQFIGGYTGADSHRAQLYVAIGWAIVAAAIVWRTRGTLLPRKGTSTAPALHLTFPSATTLPPSRITT